MSKWVLLIPALLMIVVAAGASAQELLYTLESPNADSTGFFGISVAGAGDVDNDGYRDVVVGASFEDGGAPEAGRAYIFSGQTGALLHTLQSPNPEEDGYFGCSVSRAGDLNSDGYGDVVAGAWLENGGTAARGHAHVFSGETGDLLWTLESPNAETYSGFGLPVVSAGDVDNDGYDDVAVGAGGEGGGALAGGRVYVFSGQTESLLWTLESPNAEDLGSFGSSVSGAGDANNDGYDDVVVGAMREDGGAPDAGRAYVFSGQTGSLLWTLEPPNPEWSGQFGRSVSRAGDIDNDGYDDVLAGAQDEGLGGRAYVFSGQTGSLLRVLESPNAELGGAFGAVSGGGDANNDGYDDHVVGASGEGGGAGFGGRAYVFSGRTGIPLWTLESPNAEDFGYFGNAVGGLGDVNNDGDVDVVVGAYQEDGGAENAGRAYVFSLVPAFSTPDPAAGPRKLALLDGPFPNPTAGDGVRVGLRVLEGGPTHAVLGLYDTRGRCIATVLDGTVHGGDSCTLCWSPQRKLSPGVYWWRLSAGRESSQRPMVVIR